MQRLLSGFFQLGYVTRDLDHGCALLRERFGAADFLTYAPQTPDGTPSPTRRIALAYIDDVMVELIEPDPTQPTIFDEAAESAGIRLHHLGFLIEDYPATLAALQRAGHATPLHGSFGSALDFIYADTRAVCGHYSEYIRWVEEGRTFFASLPRTKTH